MSKNILHIIYQTNIIGGVENFLSTLLSFLKNNDLLVQVYNKKNNTHIKNKIINLDEKLHSYNPIVLLYQTFSRAIKYKNICKKENIDISISHGDSLNLSNIISKLLFGNKSKVYIFLHNSLSFYTNAGSSLYKYLFNYFYPKADKVITISKEMAYELELDGYTNIKTLYNPIDFSNIEKLKKEPLGEYKKYFNNGKRTFITVGRLEEVKNISFIIETFNNFNKSNPDYQLLIIGYGKEKENLEKIIIDSGNKNIHLLGKQDNVYKFLNSSDYFLFSSLNEGFGRVLIEALACDLPILTHDFKYGAKETIRNNEHFSDCTEIEIHENGILTPYMNKEKYLQAINKITKTNFDKNKIRNNIQKYDINLLQKNWKLILNNK